MRFGKLRYVLALFAALTSLTAVSCSAGKESGGKADGSVTFTLEVTPIGVTPMDAKTDVFTVVTAKKTVGEALLDEGLIAGETSQYGLFVTTVNGVTADYAADGSWWAFYVDGETAAAGVDSTDAADGAVYAFKQEK